MTGLTAEGIIDMRESLPTLVVAKIQVTTLAEKTYIFDRTVFIHPAYLKDVGIVPGKAMHQGIPVLYDHDSTVLLERSGYHVDAESGTWFV